MEVSIPTDTDHMLFELNGATREWFTATGIKKKEFKYEQITKILLSIKLRLYV